MQPAEKIPATEFAPIEQKQRAVVVDTLRGFALTGVLIANFTGFNNDQQVPADILQSISSPLDNTLMRINTVFIEWKFMTLFSILFGYGFGLLMTSVEKKGVSPNLFFIRRMWWLFVIGLIHSSFWWYDVLNFYSISGLLLLLFRKATNSTILICSFVFMFIVPFCYSLLTRNQPETFTEADYRTAYENFKHGDLITLFKTNWWGFYHQYIQSGSDASDIIETLGRFLFGYFLLRIKLFESIETKAKLFRNAFYLTLPFAVAYLLIRWMSASGEMNIESVYWEPFIKLGIFSTTCCYSCIVVMAFISFGKTGLFRAWQALGKMTLTNYLLVSAAMIILLYGIGFGKLGELPMHTIWLFALAWFVIEIIFSSVWLRSFRYGPVEWIWRQLSYGKRFPLRK